jgi:2-hydroxycyclohexanecarboxyl-CoA dehydrogenase
VAVSLVSTTVAGKVALVTGAGQGVGRQVALTLAEHGARAVVVNDADCDRAEQVAHEVRSLGAGAEAAHADVGDFDAVTRMFERAASEFGPVNVLINNAGSRGVGADVPQVRAFWEQDTADWALLLRVNLLGVINCTRNALAQMVPVGYGRVVTVISDAGRVGETNGMEVYSGAKAGAAGFTRSVARLGGRFGVTANCIALGATKTPATEVEMTDDALAAKVLSRYIVRRFGEPADAAAAVLFLSSESAGWITGQTLAVNCGYSLAL